MLPYQRAAKQTKRKKGIEPRPIPQSASGCRTPKCVPNQSSVTSQRPIVFVLYNRNILHRCGICIPKPEVLVQDSPHEIPPHTHPSLHLHFTPSPSPSQPREPHDRNSYLQSVSAIIINIVPPTNHTSPHPINLHSLCRKYPILHLKPVFASPIGTKRHLQ